MDKQIEHQQRYDQFILLELHRENGTMDKGKKCLNSAGNEQR